MKIHLSLSLLLWLYSPRSSTAFIPTTKPLQPLSLAASSTDLLLEVPILPARQPLNEQIPSQQSKDGSDQVSVLSWNILLPNSQDNWWNHKMYNPWVPMEQRQWEHRQALIKERLLESQADIICLQEADGDTFEKDFAFLQEAGYRACLHNKYRFRCATFYRDDKFELEDIAHKDRVLVTSLKAKATQSEESEERLINIVNCHLSGGAAPERRLRQVHQAMDQVRKWKQKASDALQKQKRANRPNPKNIQKAQDAFQLQDKAGTLVCGDFNSDGNTGVRKLLVDGSVDPDWREPQYPAVPLTSKPKRIGVQLSDAAELAYASNVCDGDYGHHFENDAANTASRPPTYVVPNLAAVLLSPPTDDEEGGTRTEFGPQVARGLANTLGLQAFSENEMELAFERIDLDGNNRIDEEEVQTLLESVYVETYGKQIRVEREKFFEGLHLPVEGGLTKDQFAQKLQALQLRQKEQKHDTRHHRNRGEDFDQQMPKGVMDTLGIQRLECPEEVKHAFDSVDKDGNNLLDPEEIQSLVESAYLAVYGEQIEAQKASFFDGFQTVVDDNKGSLSREQFVDKLCALQEELEGGSQGSELVEVRTKADARSMVARFSPLLQSSLDLAFDRFSSDGSTLTQDEVNAFLIQANGELGRGGTARHTAAILEQKTEESKEAVLTREDWYEVFARELGEGKWWQVVYDLEQCGASIRAQPKAREDTSSGRQHYQGWLDYIYFDGQRLNCQGFQEALTPSEVSRIYQQGDALPNAWHPSDHLPVAAVFNWI